MTEEQRYRLRNGETIVGYMRKYSGASLFYSKDSFWWNGKPIAHQYVDEWTGYRDKNNAYIFEWDIVTFKLDPDEPDQRGVVLWEKQKKRFGIRLLDGDPLFIPFVMEGIEMFNPRQIKVYTYLFINPDLMDELGLEED
ncbi:MAG: hypothetical protein LAT76_10115 [Schleiferiaceae bacterium]|nr:hypothetical protein [Schleiferiaceae bacterium]